MNAPVSHLDLLESQSIHIFREAAAQFRKPVLLYSIGKDSTVLLHLARKAFWPQKPPFPLLHIDTTWKPRDMIAFRDRTARELGLELIVHKNAKGLTENINPIDHAPSLYTDVMKTQALKQALDAHGFDGAFGGARRDEEASRAKERVFSFRASGHRWDPRKQRPEMWNLLNGRLGTGETARIFPLSNWTERDVWRYVLREKLDVVPLYMAAERPTIERDGQLIMLDDDRMPLEPGERRTHATHPFPHARLLATDSRHRVGCSRHRERCHRDPGCTLFRARRAPDRPRSGRRHGEEKAGRLLLMSRLAMKLRPVSDRVSTSEQTNAARSLRDLDGIVHVLTCGSVDDGKSTLIGRLLWDTGDVADDQRAAMLRAAGDSGEPDLSLLVDGLLAEREQGITIDIAWRYVDAGRRRS